MLQPTDRVIAKTLAKMLGVYSSLTGISKVPSAQLMLIALKFVVGENAELRMETMKVVKEASEELNAERQGLASSINHGPAVPQPWEEDAGSGDIYDEYDPTAINETGRGF